jgi:hypothetical protein
MFEDAYRSGVELVGYHDLHKRPAFKLAMQEVDGRFFLYAASFWQPGLSILEVTDPSSIRFVKWVDMPANTFTIQVQVADGKMVTALEHVHPGWGSPTSDPPPRTGLLVWDVSDPENPVELGNWNSGGRGTHRNFYAGGRYIHAAAGLSGFTGNQYVAIDIDDPTNPIAVGQWWYPGQADSEAFSDQDESKRFQGLAHKPTEGISLHGGAYVCGDRAYCPWGRAGMVILDISDITMPKRVSILSFYPPLGSSIACHTVVPFPERSLAIVNDEALHEERADPVNFAGLVDISDETDPVMVALFPQPRVPDRAPKDFFDRGGRFGPHNQHQPQGQACLEPSSNRIYLTYFNAGLQIYDISDIRSPVNTGYFVPPDPAERRAPVPAKLVTQVEDVIVDRRGIAYISEKNSGIYALQVTA